jgi:hypothetical protein
MKKLVFLLCFAFCGCTCMLSQVPPQTIYTDASCQGVLPDYTKIVTAVDNCGTVTLTQAPAAGFVLTVANPVQKVTVTGRDQFGNTSRMTIDVVLVDTVPPVLNWPAGQVAMTDAEMMYLYQNWESAIKVHGIAKWIYDQRWTQGIPFADTTRILESLKTFTHAITLTDAEYAQFVAFTQNGK